MKRTEVSLKWDFSILKEILHFSSIQHKRSWSVRKNSISDFCSQQIHLSPWQSQHNWYLKTAGILNNIQMQWSASNLKMLLCRMIFKVLNICAIPHPSYADIFGERGTPYKNNGRQPWSLQSYWTLYWPILGTKRRYQRMITACQALCCELYIQYPMWSSDTHFTDEVTRI